MPMLERNRGVRIGDLRHRVTLQDYTITRASTGEDAKAWFDVATVWAGIEPLPTRWREYFIAQQTVNEVTVAVTLRYRSELKPRMRFAHQGRHLYIESIVNLGEENRFLQVFCSEVER